VEKQNVLESIQYAISAIEAHIAGVTVDNSVKDIPASFFDHCRKELKEMKYEILQNSFSGIRFGMGKAIMDCCPNDSVLTDKILNAKQKIDKYWKSKG